MAPFNREQGHAHIAKNADIKCICSTIAFELDLKNRVPPPSTMLVVFYISRAFDQDFIHPKYQGIEQNTAFTVENTIPIYVIFVIF